jgi:hypothetical protein
MSIYLEDYKAGSLEMGRDTGVVKLWLDTGDDIEVIRLGSIEDFGNCPVGWESEWETLERMWKDAA